MLRLIAAIIDRVRVDDLRPLIPRIAVVFAQAQILGVHAVSEASAKIWDHRRFEHAVAATSAKTFGPIYHACRAAYANAWDGALKASIGQ